MKNLLKRLWQEDEGQDLVEYALLLVMIALVLVTTLKTVGDEVNNIFSNTASNLT